MSKINQPRLETTLWCALVLMLALAGWHMLLACGVSLLGYEVRFCVAATGTVDPEGTAEVAQLARRVSELEQLVGDRQCRTAPGAPLSR